MIFAPSKLYLARQNLIYSILIFVCLANQARKEPEPHFSSNFALLFAGFAAMTKYTVNLCGYLLVIHIVRLV